MKISQQGKIALRVLLLALGLTWIWFSAEPDGLPATTGITSPRTGFAAPDFELTTQTGESVRLSDLRGKPVLINIWASWCEPCKAEMPAIQAIYEEYQPGGLVVLAVNSTIQDDPQRALAFVQDYNLTFPVPLDADGNVTRAYLVNALPTTFFVDTNGIVREVVIGGPMTEASLRARVEKLIGGNR